MIHTVLTHWRPHLDEIFAFWLLRKFGGDKYPGIENAQLKFHKNGNAGLDPVAAEMEGILMVGVGGGRLDEHATATKRRTAGECATTLVAKDLGVENDPALSMILAFVKRTDLNKASEFDFAWMVNTLHRTMEQEVVVSWAITTLERLYQDQQQTWVPCMAAFKRDAKIETVGEGRTQLRVATIQTDLESMAKYAIATTGGNCDVVIIQKGNGTVQILTKQKSFVDLADVARLVRCAEQQANKTFITRDPEILGSEGTVPGAEAWYYQPKGQMLLNGSLTHPDVTPTKLPFEAVRRLVMIGVDPSQFEKDHQAACRRGICTAHERPCSWKPFGLNRCRRIQERR